ncbi:flagellar filament capping protein FliD [Naasia aerilata]|uniref:Flagellar hook-associated protein 2 n=1 Tax=Naasia aerilata TaxID=1162966 RepID=A0ABM8GA81_9MICO|nr:flagellar filament capping protein FliD [Naasia aerilata]BDZ45105.1 flagellar hook-associated protein 2 [Naasia aerilata]
MAGLGIDGLASGLDTTSIINQLMTLEARPQVTLKSTLSATTAFATDLRSLNTAVAAVAASAKTASTATSLAVYKTTSSAASVTATARNTAAPGSLTFAVDQTAQRQITVTAAMSTWASTPPTLTIKNADGTATSVTAATNSLADVASAINGAGKGVSATVVSAGTDTGGTKLYRLQLTATASGASGGFTVYRGSAADVTAGTAVDLSTETGAATVTAARDASVTLWGGTAAAQTITSSSNTFTDLLPGLDVTVTSAEATPVTLTTAQDTGAAAGVAAGLFNSLIAIFSGIDKNTAVTTSVTAGTTSGTTVKAGSFTGDSAIRQLKDALLSAATSPVDSTSLNDIGIKITRDGTVQFDSAAFSAALQKDPTGTAAKFQTVAGRIATAATAASDSTKGYITSKIAGQDKQVASLNDQISDWDLRLAARKDILQKQYNALETALSSMKSQSDWLSSQLGNLMTSSSSSSSK